jgi:hypothetical protein
MRSTDIINTGSYVLTSYGNGTAYALKNLKANASVFFQGDDASAFWDRLQAYEDAAPNRPTSSILRELWSDYEHVAAPIN